MGKPHSRQPFSRLAPEPKPKTHNFCFYGSFFTQSRVILFSFISLRDISHIIHFVLFVYGFLGHPK